MLPQDLRVCETDVRMTGWIGCSCILEFKNIPFEVKFWDFYISTSFEIAPHLI